MFSNWMGDRNMVDRNMGGNIATLRVYGLLKVLGLFRRVLLWTMVDLVRWRAARLTERMHATCKLQNKCFQREGKGRGQYIRGSYRLVSKPVSFCSDAVDQIFLCSCLQACSALGWVTSTCTCNTRLVFLTFMHYYV